VFILCAGRTGSTTIIRAFEHAANFTAGHESRADRIIGRCEYPDQHIEADNRLSWFLGTLERLYGDEPLYVHLTRDRQAVVESHLARWNAAVGRSRPGWLLRHPRMLVGRARRWLRDPEATRYPSIARGFAREILIRPGVFTDAERRQACELFVQTVEDNIDAFLATKSNVEHVAVESFADDFRRLWERIGAEGDLEAALAELAEHHNRYLS
jgi:hypothetical protein